MQIQPNYIVDSKNRKIAVQLDIETFDKITKVMEDFALYNMMKENKDNAVLSAKEAREYYKQLKQAK